MNILITGGAGFIGSKLTKRLTEAGHNVTIIDSLHSQIHGEDARFSTQLLKLSECVLGNICDTNLVAKHIRDKDVIIHLAAETGTGQSMYSVSDYSNTNLQGTSILLDNIVNHRPHNLQKIIVASSRAVYGEGQYKCPQHKSVYPKERISEDLKAGRFEPVCPFCSSEICVEPTSETAPFSPASFYGLTKQVQEQMVLMFARALGIDAFALRYQNVYGPGQSLSNPYTGILAVFSNLVRQGKGLNIFEDGLESRDFVYIEDVVSATSSCVKSDIHGIMPLNVGSAVSTTVLEVARKTVSYFNSDVPIQITGEFRIGDIRHNIADISKLNQLTGFVPKWTFDNGFREFLNWASNYTPSDNGYEKSIIELQQRGMMGKVSHD
jgi:dTDP-L-rhamnose 4-epimerase